MKPILYIRIIAKKQILSLLFLLVFAAITNAQNATKNDFHNAPQNAVIRIEGNQAAGLKGDNESSVSQNQSVFVNDDVNFTATSEGIYLTITNGTNKIKLFALTGQLLLDGELSQGQFKIPTRKGIYFLKVNNKSFKVICK